MAVFLGCTVFRDDALDLSVMAGGRYGNIAWFMCSSFSGSIAVLSLSMIAARIAHEGSHPFSTAAITYIGSRTMGIYLLHKNMLQELFVPFAESLMPNAPELITATVASIIALAVSVAACAVIGNYIPQLLGKFPNARIQEIDAQKTSLPA